MEFSHALESWGGIDVICNGTYLDIVIDRLVAGDFLKLFEVRSHGNGAGSRSTAKKAGRASRLRDNGVIKYTMKVLRLG